MRISTADFFRTGVQGMLDQQSQSSRTQQQLATGKRFNNASQDPTAAASAQRLKARLNELNVQTKNIDFARTDLNMEEQALNNVTRLLDQAREIAIAAGNSSSNSNNRQNEGVLVRQLVAEMVATANSRDAHNNYLFAGYANANQPFTLAGDNTVSFNGGQDQRSVNISDGRNLAVADSGFTVFQNLSDGNGDFTANPLATNVGTGVIDPGEIIDSSAYDGQNYSIQIASKTTIDPGVLAFNDADGDDTLGYSLEINGVVVDTLAEGDSRTLTQIASNITAQNGTTGVSARVDSGVLYLVNDSPGGGAITISETLTGSGDPGDSVVGVLGTTLRANGSSNLDTTLSARGDAYVALDASSAVVTAGDYSEGADISFAGLRTQLRGVPDNGDQFQLNKSGKQDVFATLTKLADSLENSPDTPLGRAQLQNAMNQVLKELDIGLDNINAVRTEVGMRLQSLDAMESTNAALDTQLRQTLSDVEDIDIAGAATLLSEQLLSLQAAQQSFIRIQGLNLFDLL